MALFSRKNEGGLMDVIRCDEQSFLVWKWHPQGSVAGQSNKENAIRWGSSIRVKEGEVAVFVYKKDDGSSMDYIEGPIDGFLQTSNLPVLINLLGLAYDGKSPFQAEIYFINLAEIIQVKFAVPFFDVFDPRFEDYSVPVAGRGTLTFKIKDYEAFVKLHRLSTFTLDQFQAEIRDFLSNAVKSVVANAPHDYNIPVIQLERQISAINDSVKDKVAPRLESQFGVVPSSIDIGTIEVDKTSEGYAYLKQVTQDVTTATVQAKAQAEVQNIHDMQEINAEHARETLRIQREEAQYAQHLQTQGANLQTHQLNQQAAVAMAGANALGQMGSGGTGDAGGGGMNPAGIMASMAMGGVIGQNMASMMNGMFNGMNQPQNQAQAPMTPPPLNSSVYHVAINGAAAGPYGMQELSQMVATGQLQQTSLVWKPGMDAWTPISSVPELMALFNSVPPIPPVPPIPQQN